jgi:predicted phosphodiesterase
MRVAVFSDVHGNTLALQAVLDDVQRLGGVDAYWFVGDAAAGGYDPTGCIAIIASLPGLRRVRGNTDRMTVRDNPGDDAALFDVVVHDRAAATRQLSLRLGKSWTRGAVTTSGGYNWLADMPVEERVSLADGTRVLLVHAAPGTDAGPGIRTGQSEAEVGMLLAGAAADLVIVGHTHQPLDRNVNGVRVWNPGSVSNPVTDDTRAMWTLLEAAETGYTLTRQYASYDIDAMLGRLAAAHHPAEKAIRETWDGKVRS